MEPLPNLLTHLHVLMPVSLHLISLTDIVLQLFEDAPCPRLGISCSDDDALTWVDATCHWVPLVWVVYVILRRLYIIPAFVRLLIEHIWLSLQHERISELGASQAFSRHAELFFDQPVDNLVSYWILHSWVNRSALLRNLVRCRSCNAGVTGLDHSATFAWLCCIWSDLRLFVRWLL